MTDTTTSSPSTQPEAGASLDAQGVAALLIGRDSEEPAAPQQRTADRASVGSPQSSPQSSDTELDSGAPDDGPEAISIPVLGQPKSPGKGSDALLEDDPEEPAAEEDKDATEWPDSAKKRIGKLTAQKHGLAAEKEQLSARVQELEQELTARPQQTAAAPSDVPMADVPDFQSLEDRRQSALRAMDWLLANPYGGEVPDGKGGSVELSAQDVQDRRAKIERVLQVQIPQRERWLMEHAAHNDQIAVVYPDLFKEGPQSQAAHGVMQELPELARRPDYVAVVGDILVGRAVRSGQYVLVPRGERKARPQVAATAVPPSTTPAAPVNGKAGDAARQQFLRTGEPTDLAAAIESRI
jgi:hypothetical protein